MRLSLLKRGAAMAAVAALAVAGCAQSANNQSSLPSPTEVADPDQQTIRWIENPVVDLMSPEGTFIRAAVESYSAAALGAPRGWDAVTESGFPGYAHAFNHVARPEVVFGGSTRGWTFVGTDYHEVVEMRRDGDNYVVGICRYPSMGASERGGQYRSQGSTAYPEGEWLTFGPDPALAPQRQVAPPRDQKGSARRPMDNVFGTWVIISSNVLVASTLPQCAKLAPGTPPDWPPDTYIRSDPPPTLPPYPGWPDTGKA